MNELLVSINPAEEASQRALTEVYSCMDNRKSFLLEAGAGAGKTYTLIKALQFLINRDKLKLQKLNQRIACITFTNIAKEEIETRTDRSPLIFCNTIHAFCWSLLSGFQKQMREIIPQLEHWPEKISEVGNLGNRSIEYLLGYRNITDDTVSIHHDDVLLLMVCFMDNPKFRRIITDRYPNILIDEYQDTNVLWIESIKKYYLGREGSPQFGFFGDHWQKIYGDGCGKLEHHSLSVIKKEANFRSTSTIVDCLNRMRPELPQSVVNPGEKGFIKVFHTNNWKGTRKTGQHWGGDLPDVAAEVALENTISILKQDGWDFSPTKTKILMLTHRSLANKQGYISLPSVFASNEAFTKKQNTHIAFFADVLEPACNAFLSKKYGEMFLILGTNVQIKSRSDKERWSAAMTQLIEIRLNGTIGEVIEYLMRVGLPRLPEIVERHELESKQFDKDAGKEIPRYLSELNALHAVPYKEIIALTKYLAAHSPFETMHGVKGAEFENVLIVIGRGWNQYNFNEMLEMAKDPIHILVSKQKAFERNRNLFYVASSRPQKRLSILFTQELSDASLQTINNWFGSESIISLNI